MPQKDDVKQKKLYYVKFDTKLKYKSDIFIISLVDIVLLLLTFFMVSANIGAHSSITIKLPRAEQTGESVSSDYVISINDKNEIYINSKLFKKEELLGEFKKRKEEMKDVTVVIRGDKNANYETIVSVMDYLNQAGLPKFTLSTVK